MAFATTTDVATLMRRALTAAESAAAALLIDLTGGEIRDAAGGQTIERATTTDRIAGTWSRDLELPQRPAIAVTGVAINSIAVGDGGWAWNERQTLRRGARFEPLEEIDWVDLPSPQGAGWIGGLHWGGPKATVEVTYTHGYAADDPALAKARSVCLSVVMRRLTTSPGGEVRSEQIGSYSVSFATPRAGDTLLTTAERDQIRRTYGRRGGTIIASGV